MLEGIKELVVGGGPKALFLAGHFTSMLQSVLPLSTSSDNAEGIENGETVADGQDGTDDV